MKKTAVDWLVNEMFNNKGLKKEQGVMYMSPNLVEQAKEMEKQQMKMAQMHYSSDVVGFKALLEKQFEDWYNETFKK